MPRTPESAAAPARPHADYIERVVAQAPPLTREQVDRLALIFARSAP